MKVAKTESDGGARLFEPEAVADEDRSRRSTNWDDRSCCRPERGGSWKPDSVEERSLPRLSESLLAGEGGRRAEFPRSRRVSGLRRRKSHNWRDSRGDSKDQHAIDLVAQSEGRARGLHQRPAVRSSRDGEALQEHARVHGKHKNAHDIFVWVYKFLTRWLQGIDRERVERMESRLKEDILREAERYGGAIMVIHETEEGQIFDAWERVGAGSVKTPLEVYQFLEAEGLPIKYVRVQITDGKAPKSSDFDTIALNVTSAPNDSAFVFNCQVDRIWIRES